MTQTAKLFKNGRSQAVRIPMAFRFTDCDEVFIRQDQKTGDVVLSRKPKSWDGFFALRDNVDVPDEFMADRDQPKQQERDLF